MVWLTLMRNDKWLYHILISHVRLLFSTEHVGEKKTRKNVKIPRLFVITQMRLHEDFIRLFLFQVDLPI